ncbi:MAG: tetratricopeptide repeat protein [Cyanobacteriota bacterium]|nr:tetratricopeptide repeat protein [Cyanobacteriota bacterium]
MTEIESQIANYRREIELNPQKVETYQLLADTLRKKGELEGAIACYEKILEIKPHLWGAYQALADIYRQQGQLSTAVATLEVAIKLNPDFPWFYHKLGVVLIELRRWKKAAVALRKAILINPDFYLSYEKLGDVLSKLEKWSEAVATYQKASQIQSLSYWGENKLGEALMNLGEFEEAIAAFHRAVKIDANLYFAVHNLGEALSKLKRWNEAIAKYRQAIEINSNSYWSYHNLGWAEFNLERWDEAVAAYRQAMEIKPNYYSSYNKLGEVFAKQKRLDEAIYAYLNALNLRAQMPAICPKLGEILSERSQSGLKEAINYYRRAIQNQPPRQPHQKEIDFLPRNKKLYLDLGNYLAKRASLNAAIILYNIGLEISRDDGEISRKLEEVWERKKSLIKQTESCKNVIHKNRKSFLGYYNLGVALTREEEWHKAADAYFQAIKLNPTTNWSTYRVWETLDRCGKLEEAANFYRQTILVRPKAMLPYLNLAEILTYQGKIDEALSYYETAIYKQTLRYKPAYIKNYWDAGRRQGPNFLIIGSGKGGTTSLYSYMTEHPQIIGSLKKEIHFWSKHFDKGMDWYLAHFPLIPDGKNFLTGEATPTYLNSLERPRELFNRFPKVKAIAILRNPVDRAISYYHHQVRLNRETRSLEEAITAQFDKLKENNNFWEGKSFYISSGVYVKFLKKWMSIFPREQFLILKSEDFYVEPAATMKEVFSFLELPDYQLKHYKKFNSGSYSNLSESLRRKLSDFFRPYNQELEDYLGMTFNWE